MKKILICGAYDHTGNLGVTALGNAFAAAWHSARPGDNIYLQALDGKIRDITYNGFENTEFDLTSVSLRPSRKFYKFDSFKGMKLTRALKISNPHLEILESIDMFFDVAGGDSFTDLYGDMRFQVVNAIKDAAMEAGKPLVLLPQTYGPFLSQSSFDQASKYVKYSSLCLARDVYSYRILQDLAGEDFNPEKHMCGVDMAFLLPVSEKIGKINPVVAGWISNGESFVGLNVSGLIFNQPDEAVSRYSFKADYQVVLKDFLVWVLENTEQKVVIVPHVLVDDDSVESDYRASNALRDMIPGKYLDRLAVQSSTLNQCEIKYLISQSDWFMGTRMHATIAALSTEVPTATISYSDKALGVFRSCDAESSVIDPREMSTEEVFSGLIKSYTQREQMRSVLNTSIPKVKLLALDQIRRMADICESLM